VERVLLVADDDVRAGAALWFRRAEQAEQRATSLQGVADVLV
jgi:hypothetical protein